MNNSIIAIKQNDKYRLSNLEMHIAHTCNMKCKFCMHYCDIGYSGIIAHHEGESWLKNWSKRLAPDNFRILGGEPLLNNDIVKYILSAAQFFPNADRDVVTNGLLLKKRRDILPVLIETNTALTISIHPVETWQQEKMVLDALELAHQYQNRGLTLRINNGHKYWLKLYRNAGASILPFDDNDAAASRKLCGNDLCRTIHQGKLWNCPPLAYLPLIMDQLEHKKAWAPYLRYEPASIDAADEELARVVAGTSKFCGMCPAKVQRVEVTGRIPLNN